MIPEPRRDVRVRNYRGTLYLAREEHSLELSEVAAFVWRRLDGKLSLVEMASAVADEYDIDYDTAYADCGDLVAELAKAGMLDLKS